MCVCTYFLHMKRNGPPHGSVQYSEAAMLHRPQSRGSKGSPWTFRRNRGVTKLIQKGLRCCNYFHNDTKMLVVLFI